MQRSILLERAARFLLVAAMALTVIASSGAAAVAQQSERGFVRRTYEDAAGKHGYVVFVPDDYTPRRKWPVILFLHGAGERGTDGWRQTTIGLGPAIRARKESFPYLAVFPQAEDVHSRVPQTWTADSPDGRRALQILAEVEQDYAVDRSREILTGWSTGGYGAWSLGVAQPDRWAAVVPVSGGGDPEAVAPLAGTPVWAFHGADDGVVPPTESRKAIAALREAGGDPLFSELPGVGHEAWRFAYTSDAWFEWLRNPRPASRTAHGGDVEPEVARVELDRTGEEFVPAVEIPRAVSAHFGSRALEAISHSIPGRVPDDLLSGGLNDVFRRTRVEGRTFNVRFSRLSYSASLHRVQVQAMRAGRVGLSLGLEDVSLTIGRTTATGSGRSAAAGPIRIVIGHRRPVWLSATVEPLVVDRRIRLRLRGVRFDIPRDNWYVSAPQWVSTRGLFFSEDRARRGIVNGLYRNRRTIEQQVESIAPRLLERLERELGTTVAAAFVERFWPLPTTPPRVRVWPHRILSDENGITLSMGLSAAAIDPSNAPEEPRRVEFDAPPLEDLPREDGLRLAVDGRVLDPLTELVAASGSARVHVLDIPYPEFEQFADRTFLEAAIPEVQNLPPEAELWPELVLSRAMTLEDASGKQPEEAEENAAGRFAFGFQGLSIEVRVKRDPAGPTTPFAVFDFRVRQPAGIVARKPSFTARGLQIEWRGSPTIEAAGRFADGYVPENDRIDVERVRRKFESVWAAVTAEPLAQARVSDIDLDRSRLRLSEAGWSAPHFAVEFGPPGTKLTNDSDRVLTYELRGPYSGWGGPYELPPGESHEFDVTYDTTYRHRVDGRLRRYTLPAGSSSRFVVEDGDGRLYRAAEDGF